ncbi:MAG: hypothetical protein DMF49_07535 [Acidobacteria bacterium]|nr:MAG: hypothetical protein DMF49_07535 [Acidobacteriota bacterium]
MATLRFEREADFVTLRLDRPHGNAINAEMVEELSRALAEIERDPGLRGALLASAHPRIFCPGLDLLELAPLGWDEMSGFLDRFCDCYRRLFSFPKPVVAAIAGHAVAGGCLLSLCADYRVLQAEGAMLGLNEVRLGVPLPWGAAVIVRQSVFPSKLAEVVMLGRNFTGEAAVAAGLAQELAPAGEVEKVARERLAEFLSKDPAALASLKGSLRGEAERSMREGDRARAKEFLDIWFSPSTRKLVDEAVRALR